MRETLTPILGTQLINCVVKLLCVHYLLVQEGKLQLLKKKLKTTKECSEKNIGIVCVPEKLSDVISVFLQSSKKYKTLTFLDRIRLRKFFQKSVGYSIERCFFKNERYINTKYHKNKMLRDTIQKNLFENYGTNYLTEDYIEVLALSYGLNVILLDKSNSNLEIKSFGNRNEEYIFIVKYKNIETNIDYYFTILINDTFSVNAEIAHLIYNYFENKYIKLPENYNNFLIKGKIDVDKYYTPEEINELDKELDDKYYYFLENIN